LSGPVTLAIGSPSADAVGIPESAQVVRVPVNNVVSYAGVGRLQRRGVDERRPAPNPVVPPDPVLPPNPIRIRTTLEQVTIVAASAGAT
jgi:hypothetical protein